MPSPRRPLARLRALDARLAVGELPRTLAAVLVGLLVVQGAVVLDHAAGHDDATSTPHVALSPGLPSPAAAPTVPAPPAAPEVTPDVHGLPDPTPGPVAGSPATSTPAPSPTSVVAPSSPTARSGSPEAAGGDAAARGDSRPATAAHDGATRPVPDPARARFEERFPAHAAAREDDTDPSTTRWAVLIGVNDHEGRVRDNVASRQDAEDLAAHLGSLGWRDDHVLVLTDRDATREHIVEGFRWLARKTTPGSVVVVHYSGHTKQWPGVDVDGDGEVTDEGLWPSDNRFITDHELAQLLGEVRASRMWIDVAACEAAGLADPGLVRPGRVLTLSSREDEKSYEDPERGNSVWGYFLIEEALRAGYGDRDGDRVVTVEEAFAFAAPRATTRTERQSRGPQHPVLIDRLDGAFDLRLPTPPRPRPEPSPSRGCSLVVCPPGGREHR